MPDPGDQNGVFEFLQNPSTYPREVAVKRIDTHGAALFLAGDDVFKVKKAVCFPYMDFSTLEKRKLACQAEIAINRANAPGLYRGAVPITHNDLGYHIDGEGEPIEWAVHLKRFNENETLDLVASRGELTQEIIRRLADAIAASHRRAPQRDGKPAAASLRSVLTETLTELAQAPGFVASRVVTELRDRLIPEFNRCEPLLLKRGERGMVRRCHGDLHLQNVVIFNGQPVLFDALEFDEALATCDVLYDLAFVLMDLCETELGNEANQLLSWYLWLCEDERVTIEGLTLLPLFMSLRAAIRAKVLIAQARQGADHSSLRRRIDSYLKAARRFMAVQAPHLIAIGGLSGTGKTALAMSLSPLVERMPGAVHLRSDIERKHLFEADPLTRLNADAYEAETSDRVYQRLIDLAECSLMSGRSVVVDATYRTRDRRSAIERKAKQLGVPFMGIWLEAPPGVLKTRIAQRQDDASDATPAVLNAQITEQIGKVNWHRLDASRPIAEVADLAVQLLAARDTAGGALRD